MHWRTRAFLMTVVVLAVAVLGAAAQTKKNQKPEVKPAVKQAAAAAFTHIYEFTRPGFSYGRILIEHDDTGKGQITFRKDGDDEDLTDPIELSAVTMANLRQAIEELGFLTSTEEYQYARDYSHLGNIAFTLKRGGQSRTVKFNWTENKAARALMDEYRRIGNEYTWRFEMLIARQNMPLQTPGLMDLVDSYYRRGELTDPPHLLPFLTELSTDERLPLMARNRALKLIKEIGKSKK